MWEILEREGIYLWFYFSIQLKQIFLYWVIGIMTGSVISVFAKAKIHAALSRIDDRKWGLFGIFPASLLGILSPLCMYGTIPIAASFAAKGVREEGVPMYVCGGGTIPLLMTWLNQGMSYGAATSFMLTGPATKITNLGAVKIVLGMRHFLYYLLFVMLYALLCGGVAELIVNEN